EAYEVLIFDANINANFVRIFVIYRIPSLSQKESEKLWKILNDFTICQHPSVMMGDFNIPAIQWPLDKNIKYKGIEEAFVDFVEIANLIQTVEKPSRDKNFLDLIFTNDHDLITNVEVTPPIGNSDHHTITYEMSIGLSRPQFKTRKNFSKGNYEIINSTLAKIYWEAIFRPIDSVHMYEKLLDLLIDRHIPMTRVNLSGLPIPKHIEKKTCREKVLLSSADKKGFYRYIKSKLHDSKGNKIDSLIDGQGAVCDTKAEKADVLAAAFSSVFTIDNGITPSFSHKREPIKDREYDEIFKRFEICDMIEKWKSSSCRTPDNINMCFIKKIAVPLVIPLEIIFKKSYDTAEVPKRWKHSIITPLRKKPPFSDPLNYRPVSITSFFCRVFEKCLSKRIIDDCEFFEIFPQSQYGFRKNRKWSKTWQFDIANKKCSVIHIGRKNPNNIYFVGNQQLESKECVRDLGIMIDRNLSMREHTKTICKVAEPKANLLFKALHSKDEKTLLNAYCIYVRPTLEFSSSVSRPIHSTDRDMIEKVQNSVTRRIFYKTLKCSYADKPRHYERNKILNLHSLEHRRRVNDAKLAYQITRTRGAGHKISVDIPKTKLRENSFALRISKSLMHILQKSKLNSSYSEFIKV
ncbi:hypothetical protein PMAYCL1PPCAC_27227, partial [Pristionchus mayeri]